MADMQYREGFKLLLHLIQFYILLEELIFQLNYNHFDRNLRKLLVFIKLLVWFTYVFMTVGSLDLVNFYHDHK